MSFKKKLYKDILALGSAAIVLTGAGYKLPDFGLLDKNQSGLENSVINYESKTSGKKDSLELSNLPNPKYTQDDGFKSDDTYTLFARAICGEARGQLDNEPYVHGVISSALNRQKIRKKPLREVLLEKRNRNEREVYHYTSFDPKDVNYKVIKDPYNKFSKNEEKAKEIWNECYTLSKKSLNNEIELHPEVKEATNYFVGRDPRKNNSYKLARRNKIPSWAFEIDSEGNFLLDKKERRIPRNIVAEVPIDGLRKAFFYIFENI